MSPIGLTLNLVLGALLLAALMLGLRLDRRLRALRDSHAGFAKAVEELDQAALRTQEGLSELRTTTEQARTALAGRIDQARALTLRLEQLTAAAQAAVDTPLPLSNPLPTSRPKPSMAPMAAEAPPIATTRSRADLGLEPAMRLQPANANRSRARVDDDLFEAADPRPPFSAMAGGRR